MTDKSGDDTAGQAPAFGELWRTFGRIGLINFGGPAGQIALMHRVLVEEKRWIGEGAYLRALNFCTLLPGPEAQQLATYVGWKLAGVRGGLIAGLLFILPGAAVILALSALYAYAANLGPVSAALLGLKAAVLAIVLEALSRVARRALDSGLKRAIAAVAFLALFLFSAPFPLVIAAAGACGWAAARFRPESLKLEIEPRAGAALPASVGAAARSLALWSTIWLAPLAATAALLGPAHVLTSIGAFFARLALVTFGGAYAVLAYMAQAAVQEHGWMTAGEMVDALGLAETTPGPLILVTQFVGFLAAFREAAPFTPLAAGVLGAALTLWMTFTPSFLLIFVGAPFIERLEHARPLQGALAAITAAVVGVIGNLAVWFGLHVLFRVFEPLWLGPVQVSAPDLASLDWRAALLAAAACLLILRMHRGVLPTLGVCMLAGLGLHALGAA